MNPFWIILVLILLLIYIISPIDVMPDIIPFLGWLDDTFLVGLLVYYLRYRRLPGFMARFMSGLSRMLFKNSGERSGYRSDTSSGREKSDKSQTAKGLDDYKDPYEILGVTPGASPEEIQVAYRVAAQQYHPDKVAHLGDELQELAQKKFVEIQEAYDFLSDKHS
ncbi:MAG: DnaJ domain-containing protein [Desulfobacteraceae bacterium]|nr:DnaJ domain-containing protein [Desulfobacteraceae bacterium]MBC2754673.1 DnaJ domain-containing protein [Desulfobacteraceae bacterium]